MYKWDTNFAIEKVGKVGVLYGGWSNERSVSLQSGVCMINACKRLGLDVTCFDLAKPADVFALSDSDIDLFLLGLHGGAGEDGHVQAALDLMGLNYLGSGMHSSSLCMNKVSARLACKAVGVTVVPWQAFHASNLPTKLEFEFPMCLKPVSGGSSIDVFLLRSMDEWLERSQQLTPGYWMLEPWLAGVDHFVGVLGNIALPVLEVATPDGQFFDYHNKYSSESKRVDRFVERPQLQKWTETAFTVLKCKDYARADFITIGERSWFLEMNTLPGMAPTCLLPRQAQQAGLSYEDLLLTLITSKFNSEVVCG